MSTDYEMVCDQCKLRVHAGQEMAGGGASFGYGAGDSMGRMQVAAFAFEHAWHSQGVRVEPSQVPEPRVSDGYTRPEWDQ